MASIALWNTTSNLSGAVQTAQAAPAQTNAAASTAAQAATSQEDTVKLSAAAQAKLLHQQGQSISTIASSLGTTTKAVDSYLGITVEQAIEQTLQSTSAAKA